SGGDEPSIGVTPPQVSSAITNKQEGSEGELDDDDDDGLYKEDSAAVQPFNGNNDRTKYYNNYPHMNNEPDNSTKYRQQSRASSIRQMSPKENRRSKSPVHSGSGRARSTASMASSNL